MGMGFRKIPKSKYQIPNFKKIKILGYIGYLEFRLSFLDFGIWYLDFQSCVSGLPDLFYLFIVLSYPEDIGFAPPLADELEADGHALNAADGH